MAITRFANSFISITLNLIITGLIGISSYVIYNLMLITVDSRVYETAVLRVLGMTKFNMIGMTIVSGLFFTFFGVLFGLPLSAGILYLMNGLLKSSGLKLVMDAGSSFLAIFIAFLIP
jgi:ABC-type antimicrobial peptide transport system permease subunit